MARASFNLVGLPTFIKDLEALSAAQRQKLEPAVRESAYRVQAQAQANAPRDRGDLARSIQARGKGLTWRVGLVDQDIPSRGGRNRAHRNPSVYGVWYEFGFVHRKIRKQPFMGPAVNSEEAVIDQHFAAALNKVEP